jgi:hypothetical protein
LLCAELWDYIEQLHQLVHSLEARVQKTQNNVEQIRNIMGVWSKVALFERPDGKKDTLLCIEDRPEHVQRRYVQSKMEYNQCGTQHFVLMFRCYRSDYILSGTLR